MYIFELCVCYMCTCRCNIQQKLIFKIVITCVFACICIVRMYTNNDICAYVAKNIYIFLLVKNV